MPVTYSQYKALEAIWPEGVRGTWGGNENDKLSVLLIALGMFFP
jgi:hypothetical protein